MNDPKSIAQQIAKQIAQEPFEMLKSAGEQVGVVESQPDQPKDLPAGRQEPDEQQKQRMMMQGQRQLQALEAEIEDIRKQREKKKQEELLAEQQQLQQQSSTPLEIPTSKPNRKFAGEGLGAKRQQTHVENPLPPSG